MELSTPLSARDGTPRHILILDSLDELMGRVSAISDRLIKEDWHPANYAFSKEWVGRPFGTWGDIERAVYDVWPEGMQIYDEMKRAIEDAGIEPPQNRQRVRKWSEDDGDEMDLDRLQHDQAYWSTTTRKHRPGPQNITIISSIDMSCSVRSRECLWRGAAAVALTELLEAAGYRVELWCCRSSSKSFVRPGQDEYGWFSTTKYDAFACAVRLKTGSEAILPSTLINAVSGWCFRTIWFGAQFSMTNHKGRPAANLGYPATLTRDLIEKITPDTFTPMIENIWNEHAAVDWIKTQLELLEEEACQR